MLAGSPVIICNFVQTCCDADHISIYFILNPLFSALCDLVPQIVEEVRIIGMSARAA
jgi:hypothetical protein